MQKNEEYIVKIIDNGINGEGVAKIDGKVIFVPYAIEDEIIKIKILKVNKDICFGKIVDIIQESKYRKNPECLYYNKCGGCNFRHIDYDKGLEIKKETVQTTIKKAIRKRYISSAK